MLRQQRTIEKKVSCSGVALHNGKQVSVTLHPAPDNHGIVFVRTDHKDIKIPCHVDYSQVSSMQTVLQANGSVIKTPEHLLAVLYGLQIDNVLVELDNEELPIGDGSARIFVDLVKQAGVKELEAKQDVYELKQTVGVKDKDNKAILIAMPSDTLKISCTIVFDNQIIGNQFQEFDINPENFIKEIADARTFIFEDWIKPLQEKGFSQGADVSREIIFTDKGMKNKEPLKFPDECVRHKILDIYGDLVILGKPLQAHIIAVRPGHTTNSVLVKEIYKTLNS